MRSVTSFFNPTLFRKNLARFWPLWTVWTVLWAFVMPLSLLNQLRYRSMTDMEDVYRIYRDCLNMNGDLSEMMIVLGAGYCVFTVMAVFGYLFNHRAAATIHALPMRRETLFVTNYLSGLTFIVLPNVLVYGSTALVELTCLPAELSAVAMGTLWDGFWMGMGSLLFLYSFAVFCAQFTGNMLALPAFFGILNFLVYVMYYLCVEFAGQIFYGGWPFLGTPRWVELLTPIYALMEGAQWNYIGLNKIWNSELEVPVFGELELHFRDPGLIAGYAVAGLVLAGLALLVYRRRHIETAGDVVSVKVVRPIFRTGVAVCAGLCGGIIMAAFFGWYGDMIPTLVCVFVWTVIGYFVAEMLLLKSFRVLKKAWKGSVVTALVLLLFGVGCFLDVFGVETWTPDPGKVAQATIHFNSTYPYDDASHFTKDMTDPVEIEKIVDLHEAILDDYKEHGDVYYGEELMYVRINYIMDNGVEYYKSYNTVNLVQDDINKPGTTTFKLNEFVNDPAVLEWAYGMEQARESKPVITELVNVVYPSGRMDSVTGYEGAQEIWEAVQADFAAGHLGKRYLFDDEVRRSQTYMTDLKIRFLTPEKEGEESSVEAIVYEDLYYGPEDEIKIRPTSEEVEYAWNWSMTITLTPDATRTIAALEKYYELGEWYDLAVHE